jgi:uncharacterized protein (DUF1697 family)
MNTCISLLRGINVSGQKIIKMAELKALFEAAGFRDVTTYIQSGNVLFRSKKNPSDAGTAIANAIRKQYGFDVTVIVRQPDELASVIKKNPFAGRRGIDETKLHVTFLREQPSPALVKALAPLAAKSKDEYRIVGREVYLHCPTGYGNTLLTNTFFEKHLKVAATTRNCNTINTLLSMADSINGETQ